MGGLTIKLIFNKDSKWTKALKYMVPPPPPSPRGRVIRGGAPAGLHPRFATTVPCPACVAA